jgi:hypothetical protein
MDVERINYSARSKPPALSSSVDIKFVALQHGITAGMMSKWKANYVTIFEKARTLM